ncbi:MAG: glycosyl hydrolase 115 family protein, partial [Opitutaceae bacterium]
IWIVNVGDLKPMEFPIEFFLDMARRPQRWTSDRLGEFGRLWAAREFGPEHADEIADLIAAYTKFNGRRKPELLSPDTYSLVDYREADTVVRQFNALDDRARRLDRELPPQYRDAFYELVLYPVAACANLNDLYVTVGKNRLYAAQGRVSANALARRARMLFGRDAELSRRYNRLDCGKWDHMMDQTHIGYTGWQEPPRNIMPAVAEVTPRAAAALGVAVEGSAGSWPPPKVGQSEEAPSLPELNAFDRKSRYIDVFNRGKDPCSFTAAAETPWLTVTPDHGELGPDARLSVGVIWDQAPVGRARSSVEIVGSDGTRVTVAVSVFNPAEPRRSSVRGFVETDGYVSIEAAHYSRAVASGGIGWRTIPDYGRTLSGVTSFPVTAPSASTETSFKPDAPRLEYRMYLFSTGTVKVELYASPTLAFVPGRGVRCAVSFDDAPPEVVDLQANRSYRAWAKAVSDSIRILTVPERIDRPGPHVLKIWRVDPAFVLEKIVVDAGGVRPSYLGPPESFRGPAR